MAQILPKKLYVFTIVVTRENNSKEIVDGCKVNNDENEALKEYFRLERKANTINNANLLFEVNNLEDSTLDHLERYSFFSKVQEEKDKQRLPFND